MKIFLVITLVLVPVIFWTQTGEAKEAGTTPTLLVNPGYGKIPLYFIPNKGQSDRKVLFYAKTSRYTLWLTKEGLTFEAQSAEHRAQSKKRKTALNNKRPAHSPKTPKTHRDVSRFIFLEANKNPAILPMDKTNHRVHFFKGSDKTGWKTNIPTSNAVLYKSLYKKIDLKVYGIERQVEYDWMVKPGADPEEIKWMYKNVKGTRIDGKGNLRIETVFGELLHKKPVGFQVIEGKRIPVAVVFKKMAPDTYGFRVKEYNRNYELIIDPVVLAYSTYLGGSESDDGKSIAVDSSGSAYITGYTRSPDFPTENPFQGEIHDMGDGYVSKLSPDGSQLVYSTYFGGSDWEYGKGIGVDSGGSACVIGYTYSTDFPTRNALQGFQGPLYYNDAFVLKLSPDGDQLVFSTYLGGSDADFAEAIAVDASGNAYITGYTGSANFPTKNSLQGLRGWGDGFVTKLSPDGSQFLYSTYLGGSESEVCTAIALDADGSAYVTGYTYSNDFPTKNPFQGAQGYEDGFVTKLSPGGSRLEYSTYLGGSDWDNPTGIAVDSSGHAYVAGYTYSYDFPTKNPFQQVQAWDDGFVTKLSPDGGQLVYSTYLGGNESDYAMDIAVDSSGYAYVTGITYSYDFPTRNAFKTQQTRSSDAFVTKLSLTGSQLSYSTLLGGSQSDGGRAVTLDNYGNAYVTGWTSSNDFPTKNPFQDNKGMAHEIAFVSKIPNLILALEVSRELERGWLIRKQYGKVELFVENPGNIPVSKYSLYRKEAGGSYLVIKEISASEFQEVYRYNDLFPHKDKEYTYKVEALDANGDIIGESNEKTI